MDPIISSLLNDLPDKPPRSKLEPHADVIAALRRKRQTYREIAQFLREHLSITVSPSTIHDFVRVRRRREKPNVDSAQEANFETSERCATQGKRQFTGSGREYSGKNRCLETAHFS